MKGLAESKGVQVLENNIIYRVLEQVKEVLEAKLPAVITQKVSGEADIGAVFEIGLGGRKKAKVAGCKVRNGLIARNARARVMRGGEKVYDGEFHPPLLHAVVVILTLRRHDQLAQEREEGRRGDAQGHGVWHWLRRLGGLSRRRSGADL